MVVAIDVDYDHQMRISAAATLINGLLGGQPVYSQTKFSQINTAIVGSHGSHSARPPTPWRALC
jgi:hypothetical protein